MTLAHYTAQTGHLRLQPEAEMDRSLLPLLTPLVASPGRRPIPHANGLHVIAPSQADAAGCASYLIETTDKQPVVIGLLGWSSSAQALWGAAVGWPGAQLPSSPVSLPWHAIILMPGIASLDKDTILMLGDIERCLAWAIITTAQPAG